jgi:hypothetical protein
MIRMKRTQWIAALLVLLSAGGLLGLQVAHAAAGGPPAPAGPLRRAYWRALGIRTAGLQLRVINAVTQQPVPGAGCVVADTGDRVETNAQGVAPSIDAPVFRNPRHEELLAQLHGQLTVLCYKNGYRDSIYMGVRMHENTVTRPDVFMYPIGRGDRRIEPTLYQMPVHRVWLIELADRFRLRDEGEGPERPQLTRPTEPPAPQEPEGYGVQTPPHPAPPQALPVPPEPR